MKEKISHILEGLQHSDWRIRNQAYLNLMDTTSEEALPLFWEMMDKTDDLMMIYFCRWISKNMFVSSLKYILELLSDARLRISKEAMFSIEKILKQDVISEKNKINVLVQILLQAKEEGKIFAARMAAKYRKNACGPILVRVLAEGGSPKLKKECVDALRELQERRTIPQLEICLQDTNTDVLYATLFALGDMGFSSLKGWRKLRPFLKDERATIRHVAIWAIGRLGQKKVISDLANILREDKNTTCQIEACKRLSKIQDKKVVPMLLDVAALNSDQNVKNVAIFCLDQVSSGIAFQQYYKMRKTQNKEVRVQLFIQMAKTQHPKAFLYLSQVVLKELDLHIRAAAAEALAYTENKKAIPILKKVLDGNPVVSYSAMLSLAQLMGPEEVPFVVELLENQKTPKLTQQLLLKHIALKAKDKKIFFTQKLIDVLLNKLSYPDVNITYLAAQILGESYDLSAVIPLFQLVMRSQDAQVKLKAKEAINCIIDGDVALLIKLLSSRFVEATLYQEILVSLSFFHCDVAHKSDALIKLLMVMEQASLSHRLYFISALTNLVGEDLDILLHLLEQTTWSDPLMVDILEVINGRMNEKDPKNSILPIAALKRGLLHSCSDVRKLCARILEKISNREALENLCTLA